MILLEGYQGKASIAVSMFITLKMLIVQMITVV